MRTSKNSRNNSAMSASSFASFKLDPNAMIKHSQNLQNYISSKAILQLQEKSDLDVQASNYIVGEILEREKTIIKDNIDNIIREHEINEKRRREVLNKRWNRNVYEPICERIDQSRNDNNLDVLIQKKRDIHQNFLDYSNRKDFVSLTEYCADEYYPYALFNKQHYSHQNLRSNTALRVQSANPTSVDENSRYEEDRCQVRCLTGNLLSRKDLQTLRLPSVPLMPLGRQGTDCISWLYMPYNQINSEIRIRSRKKMRGDFNHGTAHLSFKDPKQAQDFQIPSRSAAVESG